MSGSPLHDLASACGVDTEVWGWQGDHRVVDDDTLRRILAALGHDAGDDDTCRTALAALQRRADERDLPAYVVAREGGETRLRCSVGVDVTLVLEDGGERPATRDGEHVVLEADLPAGYHQLRTAAGTCTVIRPPRRVPLPPRLQRGPAWGLAAQLYSVRSRRSWGVGDLGDLGELSAWAADQGADFVLVNPLHAAEVVAPMNPSPYSPVTRRFGNPIYLRLADVPEYALLSADERRELDRVGTDLQASHTDLIDRDAAWAAKRAALERLRSVPLDERRAAAFAAYREREGTALRDFAVWCVLTEIHGGDPEQWPAALRHPDGGHRVAAEHPARVEFHEWTQWLLDEQLAGAQRAALDAGMGLGVVHDVAVGVNPTGADAWSLQGELATSVSVGAPPDAYSQTGQDWNQPPWRPDRLAELGYAPFRDLFAAALRHSGGLRVDHVIGLFRLWWIPRGEQALTGTYVRYDHDALIGVLMIEAARAGAVLIGEDLGNVEPWVRDYLAERGVFGTSILWFEYDGEGRPLPPEHWRELCLASVTTHDLPPTLGYLAGDHVRLRHELGLLTRDYETELAADRAERQRWVQLLRERDLVGDDPEPTEIVTALHRVLGGAPSLLRCAALTDAVGDRRIQNQPATSQEQHPNWRVPLSGPDGRPVSLEDLATNPRAAILAAVMRGTEQ